MIKTFNTNYIYEYLRKNNISKTEFCKRSKISYSSLKKILDDNLHISIQVVHRIIRLLNIHFADFFETKKT